MDDNLFAKIYGTILITFCTNFYLIKLITLTISDRVVIPFH